RGPRPDPRGRPALERLAGGPPVPSADDVARIGHAGLHLALRRRPRQTEPPRPGCPHLLAVARLLARQLSALPRQGTATELPRRTMNAPRRPHFLVTVALAVVILVPAMWGFGTKFFEFLRLVGDEEGAFTVVPILNYLLVSFGFLLLFVWAL